MKRDYVNMPALAVNLEDKVVLITTVATRMIGISPGDTIMLGGCRAKRRAWIEKESEEGSFEVVHYTNNYFRIKHKGLEVFLRDLFGATFTRRDPWVFFKIEPKEYDFGRYYITQVLY